MSSKPVFKHDCDKCLFLDHSIGHDLYYCEQYGMETVVARYGNEGPEYTSGLEFVHKIPSLAEARRLAIAAGLLDEQ
jgi:hypothetical protein